MQCVGPEIFSDNRQELFQLLVLQAVRQVHGSLELRLPVSPSTALDNRWFLEAVLWIGRTGSPWRDLPVEFGRWHTVYMRFSRWRRKGVWQRIALAMAGETEIEHILIDSTIVRAHQHSAGASKKVDRKRSDVPEVG